MTGSIYGIPVHVTPDTPRFQLSADCPVTDAYRADTNAWALKWCGVSNIIADGQVMQSLHEGRVTDMFVNPRTFDQLKRRKL